MILSKCTICGSNKQKLGIKTGIKTGINLGIKTPLNKIPL